MARTLAFDVDGTIVDKKGNIDPGVMALFNKADLNDTSFIFLSGNTLSNIEQTVKHINAQLNNPTGQKITPYMVANCGAQVVSPQGKMLRHVTIPNNKARTIVMMSRYYDRGAIFIYSAGNTYYVENQDHIKEHSYPRFIKNAVLIRQYKKRELEKGDMGIDIKETKRLNTLQDFVDFTAQNGGINSIYVACTSGDEVVHRSVANAMLTTAEGLPMYDGISKKCIPADSKMHALSYILNLEKDNDKYVDDVSEVVYFGDGTNDIQLLRACNLSVARGKKLPKYIKKQATYALDDCTEFAKDLYDGVYDHTIKNDEMLNRL